MTPDQRLHAHLTLELGSWPPPDAGVSVAGSSRREEPGWDGRIRPFAGIQTPTGTMLSVAPALVAEARNLLPLWGSAAFDTALSDLLGYDRGSRHLVTDGAVFRWSEAATPGEDAGEWVEPADPRVPAWLHPFNGGVLCAWDDGGGYGGGVGIKAHDDVGREIAVGTEPALRGRGLARALVATAARRILREGRLPTYIHESDNHASAHVAAAAGFPDRGFRVVGFWPKRG
jgi:GNAT superfamily N-acetyltransferase